MEVHQALAALHSLCTEGCARTVRPTCVGVRNVIREFIWTQLLYSSRKFGQVFMTSTVHTDPYTLLIGIPSQKSKFLDYINYGHVLHNLHTTFTNVDLTKLMSDVRQFNWGPIATCTYVPLVAAPIGPAPQATPPVPPRWSAAACASGRGPRRRLQGRERGEGGTEEGKGIERLRSVCVCVCVCVCGREKQFYKCAYVHTLT